MKMDNWFVDEFENIGFPSRVDIDTICENINFGLFNSGWVLTAEIVIVSHVSCPSGGQNLQVTDESITDCIINSSTCSSPTFSGLNNSCWWSAQKCCLNVESKKKINNCVLYILFRDFCSVFEKISKISMIVNLSKLNFRTFSNPSTHYGFSSKSNPSASAITRRHARSGISNKHSINTDYYLFRFPGQLKGIGLSLNPDRDPKIDHLLYTKPKLRFHIYLKNNFLLILNIFGAIGSHEFIWMCFHEKPMISAATSLVMGKIQNVTFLSRKKLINATLNTKTLCWVWAWVDMDIVTV